MAAGKVLGLIFGIIAIIGSIWVVGNGLKDIEDAEKWVAYEFGVCMHIDKIPPSVCNTEADGKGADLYNKYYPATGTQWVYGENPRLGLGPLAN